MKKGLRAVWHIFLTFFSILLILGILLVAFFTFYLLCYVDGDVSELLSLAGNNGTPSRLYTISASGELIEYAEGEISAGRNNDYATLDEIPDYLEKAFIAIEDKRFYSHIGFDPITTAKATIKYFFSSGASPGGSTITQQLIKNLTGEDDISIKRKLTEIMRAVNLERELSKDAILELYLNSIYLSQGTYGVKAAAQLYFNKDVSELTLIESAAIAAITQAPTKWDPIQNPENNKIRRNIILSEMYESGYLSEEQFQESYDQPLRLDCNFQKVTASTSSWYTDAVINEAIRLLSETLGVSEKVATHHLYNSGYRILVSVDPEVQAILERYYQNSELFSLQGVQSSFVVLDPNSGAILGLVGGLGEKTASRLLNRATQTTRSPGSAIKPLSVYLPAFETGLIHYGSSFDDVPIYFGGAYPSGGWPRNASGVYAGLVSLEYAVSHSLNTVSVHLLEQLGLEASYTFLSEKLHLSTLVREGDSNDMTLSALALGGMTNGVTLTELAAAYSPLANNGVYTNARCVLKILDRSGAVLVDNQPQRETVIREETAQSLTKLLSGVIRSPGATAYGAITSLASKTEVAGKTGTTNENNDRWFIGYTPNLIGGIWLGYDTPASLSSIELKAHIRVWDSIMSDVYDARRNDKNSFSQELLVEARYCTCSGKLATEACYADPRGNVTQIGYFTKETLPSESCDRHVLLAYCKEGKGIAGNACPAESITSVGLLLTQRSFPVSVTIADAEYTAMLLPFNYLPYISLSEPYYFSYIEKGSYVGKSHAATPYNRFCSRHLPQIYA